MRKIFIWKNRNTGKGKSMEKKWREGKIGKKGNLEKGNLGKGKL